jgi:hypothetical protein
MSKLKLNIGGEVSPGDVVGVAYNNCVTFGWYVDQGVNGSLKFISLRQPVYTEDQYKDFLNGKNVNWLAKKFANGLQFKNIGKDYIIAFGPHDNRAFKIADPEEFFKDSAQENMYKDSKRILTNLKFPAK